MKIQHTNQAYINQIAYEEYGFILENVLAGLTVDEAIAAQIEGAMDNPFDDKWFDAPYDKAQLKETYRRKFGEQLTSSATDLWRYAQVHESAYKADYTGENEIGEDVTVRVVEYGGEYYDIVTGEEQDEFFTA